MEDSEKDARALGALDGASPMTAFAPQKGSLSSRLLMIACILGGVGMMLAQHFFYDFLDQRPIDLADVGDNPLTAGLKSQSVVNAVGNLISQIAKGCLVAALSKVGIQLFWMYLRRDALTIGQVDAAIDSVRSQSKLSYLKLGTAGAATNLLLLSTFVTAMSVVTILSPGAIKTVVASFQVPNSCRVQNVNITERIGDAGPQNQVQSTVARVITVGTYLEPVNPCPPDVACRYNIQFLAPSFQCKDITQGFDFSEFLAPFFFQNPLSNSTAADSFQVWNASTPSLSPFTIQVLTRDLINGNRTTATECMAFDSKYNVTVTHSGAGVPSAIEVVSVETHVAYLDPTQSSPFDSQAMEERYLLMVAAFDQLPPGVTATPGFGNDSWFLTESSASGILIGGIQSDVINTPLAMLDNKNNIAWVNMTEALPSMLQNVSASLLSASLLPISNGGDTSPSLDTTCFYTSQIWVYHRARLLVPYAVAIFVTVVCVVLGFLAVRRNGVEESLSFSRILASVLNSDLFDERASLSKATRVQAGNELEGSITPRSGSISSSM